MALLAVAWEESLMRRKTSPVLSKSRVHQCFPRPQGHPAGIVVRPRSRHTSFPWGETLRAPRVLEFSMKRILFAALLALPALGLIVTDASANWSICGQKSCSYSFQSPRFWFGF